MSMDKRYVLVLISFIAIFTIRVVCQAPTITAPTSTTTKNTGNDSKGIYGERPSYLNSPWFYSKLAWAMEHCSNTSETNKMDYNPAYNLFIDGKWEPDYDKGKCFTWCLMKQFHIYLQGYRHLQYGVIIEHWKNHTRLDLGNRRQIVHYYGALMAYCAFIPEVQFKRLDFEKELCEMGVFIEKCIRLGLEKWTKPLQDFKKWKPHPLAVF